MPELEAAASVADVLPGGADTSLVDETPVESSEPQESTEVEQPGEELPQPGEQQAEPKEDEGDGRVLNPELRSHLKQLKALNPKLEKSIRGAFFALNSYKEVFPGGIQEAKQFKTELQQFGGFDGIKSIQESSAKLQEIDGKIEKGDPSVVDGMAEMLPVEAYPAIAGKLLDTFGAKDAEGYQRMMSGIIANTFDQSGIPFHLQRIADFIQFGKADEAVKLLGEIGKWANGFRELANQKPQPKAVDPNAEKFAQREQELNQREQKQFTETVSNDIATWSKSRVLSEAAPFLKGRKLNADQTEALEAKALTKVRNSLMGNENFKNSYAKFFNAKDRDGLLKFVKAETDKLLPGAVKDSFRLLFSDFSPKPPAAKPDADKVPAAKGTDQSFIKVSGPPRPDDVDHARTPFEWKMRSKAVLKDGRRVTWA
jgi:hypothetical protein